MRTSILPNFGHVSELRAHYATAYVLKAYQYTDLEPPVRHHLHGGPESTTEEGRTSSNILSVGPILHFFIENHFAVYFIQINIKLTLPLTLGHFAQMPPIV